MVHDSRNSKFNFPSEEISQFVSIYRKFKGQRHQRLLCLLFIDSSSFVGLLNLKVN